MRLITIDASTKSVAFGIFIDGRLEKYGKINIQGKDIYEKCANTAHTLTSFARLYQIEKAIIEKPVYVNSPQVMMMLSIAQGALIGALAVGGVRKFEGVVPLYKPPHKGREGCSDEVSPRQVALLLQRACSHDEKAKSYRLCK